MDAELTRPARAWLIVTAFLSGASVMVLEMAAVRAAAPYFGQSNYTWTNVIGVILAALAVGYFLGGRLIDRHPRAGLLFTVLLLGGLLAMVLPLLVRPVSRWLMPADLAVEGAATVFTLASLAATLILFAPPILLLGMVSPMAIRLLAVPGKVGNASGRIFASSTVGSLIGTFATTFVLLETFGTRATMALSGGVLVATAVIGLLVAVVGRSGKLAAAVGALLAVALGIGGAQAGPLKIHPDQVEEVESAYQYIRVLDDVSGDVTVRMLQFNEAEQSYQSVLIPDRVLTGGRYYDYYAALPYLFPKERRRDLDVLVIGLAAGTIPRQLEAFFPEGLSVTGVEIDPAVLELGRKHFELPESGWLTAVVMDGRAYLNGAESIKTFDLVVIDAFAQEYYVPFHLATREAFEAAAKRLKPGGIVAMNVAAYRADSALLASIESTVAHVFGRAWRTKVYGYANFMVFAVKDEEPQFKRLFDLPRDGGPEQPELNLVAAVIRTATSAVEPRDGVCLTDDLAPVERLMDRSVRRESRLILGD
ncbi:MAG: fused MFS/spermidine synthase [Planctomycetota bacterium]